MKSIKIPKSDSNSEKAIILWNVKHLDNISTGQVICSIETSKSIEEIKSDQNGIISIPQEYREVKEIDFNKEIALVFDNQDEMDNYERQLSQENTLEILSQEESGQFKATNVAIEYAKEHNINLSTIKSEGIISVEDLASNGSTDIKEKMLEIDQFPEGINKVAVFPAGYGAMQAADIIMKDPSTFIIGYLDDDEHKIGKTIFGKQVLGKIDMLEELFNNGTINSAVIAISTSNKLRKMFYEKCKGLAIPVLNVIDPSVKISKGVSIGDGNIICGNVYIGTCTKIGNNNFISANSSFDHHNILGDHITTGPGVLTSGLCVINDSVKFGMNVGVEPYLKIGENSTISSGVVITQNIPPNSIVKKKKDYEILEK